MMSEGEHAIGVRLPTFEYDEKERPMRRSFRVFGSIAVNEYCQKM
ncbi:MAG: hypothetical protein AB1656_25965 [Candidatus Omnitrophota bacterium]